MRPPDENQANPTHPHLRPNLMSSARRGGNEDSILAKLEREPARRAAAGGSGLRLAWYGGAVVVALGLTCTLAWLAAGQEALPRLEVARAGDAARSMVAAEEPVAPSSVCRDRRCRAAGPGVDRGRDGRPRTPSAAAAAPAETGASQAHAHARCDGTQRGHRAGHGARPATGAHARCRTAPASPAGKTCVTGTHRRGAGQRCRLDLGRYLSRQWPRRA